MNPFVVTTNCKEECCLTARKRKADHGETVLRVEEDGVAAVFTCPVCDEVPRKVFLYTCANGHLMCGRCHPKASSRFLPVMC